MPKKLPEFTIQRDTREQKGWSFVPEEKRAGRCKILGTIEECLPAGDYAIYGHSDLCVIERKQGFAELANNYSPVANRERFEREMEKLQDVKHKYIIIESYINKDILSLGVPQSRNGFPMRRILDWLVDLEMTYGINVIFAGDAGKKVARIIFERIARKYL